MTDARGFAPVIPCAPREARAIRDTPLVVLLGLACLLAAGCGTDCESGASYCSQGVLHRCIAMEHGFAVDYGWLEIDCGDPTLCHLDETGAAFCSLEATPRDECDGAEAACSGDTSLACRAGFATRTRECLTCTADGECEGGFLMPCETSADCLPDLECATLPSGVGPFCTVACDPGAANDDCAERTGSVRAADLGSATCDSGFCY